MRWHMHKRTEQKEDGRLIYYYTFTPANLPEKQVPPKKGKPTGRDGFPSQREGNQPPVSPTLTGE